MCAVQVVVSMTELEMQKMDEQRAQAEAEASARRDLNTERTEAALECCTDRLAARHLRLNQLVLVRSGRVDCDTSTSACERAVSRAALGAPLDSGSARAGGGLARLVCTARTGDAERARRVGGGAPLVQLVHASPLDRLGQRGDLRAALSLLWSHSCRAHLSAHKLNESSLRAAEKTLGILIYN